MIYKKTQRVFNELRNKINKHERKKWPWRTNKIADILANAIAVNNKVLVLWPRDRMSSAMTPYICAMVTC